MNFFTILVLAIVQGVCELLPISSSAHVIIAEKLMGLDRTSPEMTLLLVAPYSDNVCRHCVLLEVLERALLCLN